MAEKITQKVLEIDKEGWGNRKNGDPEGPQYKDKTFESRMKTWLEQSDLPEICADSELYNNAMRMADKAHPFIQRARDVWEDRDKIAASAAEGIEKATAYLKERNENSFAPKNPLALLFFMTPPGLIIYGLLYLSRKKRPQSSTPRTPHPPVS